MGLILIVVLLFLLFGGGGYYGVHSGAYGMPVYGGGMVLAVLLMCLMIWMLAWNGIR